MKSSANLLSLAGCLGGALVAIAGLIVSILAWVAPFDSVGPSPFAPLAPESRSAEIEPVPAANNNHSSEQVVTSAFDLRVGDCFNNPAGLDEGRVHGVGIIPCDQPHDNEIYFLVDYPAGSDQSFPGESEIDEFANEQCTDAFEPFVGLSYQASAFYVTYLQPTENTWEDGDREIVCFLYEQDAKLNESVRGSRR